MSLIMRKGTGRNPQKGPLDKKPSANGNKPINVPNKGPKQTPSNPK